jgi:hypothetical protein
MRSTRCWSLVALFIVTLGAYLGRIVFNRRAVHVGFVVKRLELGQLFFLVYFGFSCESIFHKFYKLFSHLPRHHRLVKWAHLTQYHGLKSPAVRKFV